MSIFETYSVHRISSLLEDQRLVLPQLGEGLGHGWVRHVEVELLQYSALLQSHHLLVKNGLQFVRVQIQ